LKMPLPLQEHLETSAMLIYGILYIERENREK
jgi:hypothetical protein